MYKGMHVAVVIPAKDEGEHIGNVLSTIPEFVDRVVVVDDGSKDNTAKLVKNADLIQLEGDGVGAAIDAGHQHLLRVLEDDFISVVMAGDGQMDPDDMESLLEPIISGKAHHVKGERLDRAGKMPLIRRFGTLLLSLLTTLACGQSIRDAQCGYTATSSIVLQSWNWDKSWKGYGYPNWWLMKLSEEGWKVAHSPVKAIYEGQKSGIRLYSFLPKVSLMLLLGLHLRIIRNTLRKPTFPIAIVWTTYVLAWTYNPIMFVCAHIADRVHVSTILED